MTKPIDNPLNIKTKRKPPPASPPSSTSPKAKPNLNQEVTDRTRPSPFTLIRFKGEGSFRPYCHNMHPPPGDQVRLSPLHPPTHYKKLAVAQILIIGYPTNLCQACLTSWSKAWTSALSQSPKLNNPSELELE